MDVLNYLEPKFHPILISGLGDIAIFAYKRRTLYFYLYSWVVPHGTRRQYSSLQPEPQLTCPVEKVAIFQNSHCLLLALNTPLLIHQHVETENIAS